jgi:hypothetical protein
MIGVEDDIYFSTVFNNLYIFEFSLSHLSILCISRYAYPVQSRAPSLGSTYLNAPNYSTAKLIQDTVAIISIINHLNTCLF